MNNQYQNSNKLLNHAEKYIPLGSQTFSKSKMSFPEGASPMFIERGEGARVWDVDGNQYTDYVSGLLAISLGYQDKDVNHAVINQLGQGVTFSLPHRLESELAELLTKHIPCAEMVRFGKNGSDATSAAIRIARAYTRKERIAVCGYHGWHDWYIGSTTRDLGVPKLTKSLTHTFKYNDFDSLKALLEQYPNEFAAIIMEPMNIDYPKSGFLESVRALATQQQCLLIFDETITGFRFHMGGAQALFGVTPDIATFGKGMGNGFPISAVVGKKPVMQLMEDIFFSGTFAGETLSLAASKATINKIEQHQVIEHISTLGEKLLSGLEHLIKLTNCQWLGTSGHPSWSFVHFSNVNNNDALTIKSLFIQEMAERGILLAASHNLSFAHTEEDIDYLLACYKEVIILINSAIDNDELDAQLKGKPLEAVFKVR
ncbi:aspartate aminotransferase family protein [Pseudoalteromonas sp. SS15]|uniref:aspartate aminotransferase family protein n=1 Tax=Pseudoalteromonas sp. SS15 TaxID=3139393 RepID=UPI003BACF568